MSAFITVKSLELVKTTDFIFSLIEKEFDKWFSHNSKNNPHPKHNLSRNKLVALHTILRASHAQDNCKNPQSYEHTVL